MLAICIMTLIFCGVVLGIMLNILFEAAKEYYYKKKYEKEMHIYRRMKAEEDLKVWGR